MAMRMTTFQRVFCIAILVAALDGSSPSVGIETGVRTTQRLTAPAPRHFDGALLTAPPERAEGSMEATRTMTVRAPLPVPTPTDLHAQIPAPKCASTEPPSVAASREKGGLPETFHLFANRVIPYPDNGNATSVVNEPTVANGNDLLLYTGNWYAAISDNGGASFGFIDPYDNFPQDGNPDGPFGGFCCDQVAVYDPASDAYFWGLLYADDGFTNAIRIAVADGAGGLLSNSWCVWDFLPEFYGFAANTYFFDFPDLVLSEDFLYVTANVFETSTLDFAGAVVLRLPPADMRDCIGFGYSAFVDETVGSPRCTHGAVDKMHFASHISNTTLRVFTWDEVTDIITSADVVHDPYNTGPMTAVCPDGANFAGRADDRVMGAWAANGQVGFMWNAAEGGPFSYPHLQVLRLNEAAMTVDDQVQVFSDLVAWLYPAAHPNDQGHIGGTIAYGGGSYYPGATAFIADDINGETFAPLENMGFAFGDSDPGIDAWGDYLAARRNVPFGNTWCGTGFAMVGGSTNDFVEPRYVWFGRERDCPVLSPPSDVTCTNVPGGILVTWTHVVGASEYCIYRDGLLQACIEEQSWYDLPTDEEVHCYTVTAEASGCGPTAQSSPACCNLVPVNDDCFNCQFLAGAVIDFPFSNVGASTDGPDEGINCNDFGYTQIDSDIWYCWQPTCSGDATISLCGSGYDTKVAVYDYQACPPSQPPLDCNDDFCGVQSQVTVPVMEGQWYTIRIGGYQGSQGSGLLNITIDNVQIPCPAFSEAENEPCGTDINGGCNSEPPVYSPINCGLPVCGTLFAAVGSRDTDWYTYTVFNPIHVIWTARSEIPVQLNILDLSGGCDLISTVDFATGDACVPVSVDADLPPGEYAFFIAPQDYSGYACENGPFDYTVWLTCNDNCNQCQPLYGEFDGLSFANFGATTDGPDEPASCYEFGYSQIGSDVWFCWTAGCNGDVTISLCGSSYDTKMAVYPDACPVSGPPIACSEDFCGLQSELTFDALQGESYLIRIGGYGGAQGAGTLSLHYVEVPSSDDCASAIPLVGAVFDYPFATCGATTDGPAEPGICTYFGDDQVGSDIWFDLVPDCDGNVTVNVCNSNYDTKVAVYGGSTCPTSASALACNDDACGVQSSLVFPAIGGTHYLIRIGGFLGNQGAGLLNITNDGSGCCNCPNSGDTNADGNVDALDLQVIIDVVFFGGAIVQDPACPVSRMDVTCDGFPDAVDIQYIIDYIFFGGTAPCDGCISPTR